LGIINLDDPSFPLGNGRFEAVYFGLEDGVFGMRDSELWGEESVGVREREREGRAPCFADAAESKNVDGGVEMFGYERQQFLGKTRPIHSLIHHSICLLKSQVCPRPPSPPLLCYVSYLSSNRLN